MKITAVDPFYLKMPEVTAAADGTQDTLLVRIRTDAGLEGWGECDASPLVTLAAYCWPMYALLDDGPAHPKLPYGSVLFGDTPELTRERAADLRRRGYRAAKFGWGPIGRAGEAEDVALVRAAREGLGSDGPGDRGPRLMVDAGVAWGEDAETAYARAVAFAPYHLTWLEEPLSPEAIEAYAALAA